MLDSFMQSSKAVSRKNWLDQMVLH